MGSAGNGRFVRNEAGFRLPRRDSRESKEIGPLLPGGGQAKDPPPSRGLNFLLGGSDPPPIEG